MTGIVTLKLFLLVWRRIGIWRGWFWKPLLRWCGATANCQLRIYLSMMLIDFSSCMAALLVSSVNWLVDKIHSSFEYEVGTSRYWWDVSASTSYITGPPLFIWWVPIIDISLLSSSIVLLPTYSEGYWKTHHKIWESAQLPWEWS